MLFSCLLFLLFDEIEIELPEAAYTVVVNVTANKVILRHRAYVLNVLKPGRNVLDSG